MWNPFKKTLSAHTKRASVPTKLASSVELDPIGPAVVPALKRGTAPSTSKVVDCNFVALIMGRVGLQHKVLSPHEAKVLSTMREWVRSPQASAALPRLPAALPKLMGLLRRDDVSVPELAEHLSHDPALLGEMIRIANSTFYRTSRPVASVADAVQIIGQTGLRQLVTRVAMGPVFGVQSGYFSKLASGPLWEQAERCATACAWLRREEGDAFDAYLAGMVSSTGLIAVLRMLDREMEGQVAPDAINFYAEVHACSVRLSSTVARQWGFPQQVVDAMVAREPQTQNAKLHPFALAVQRADHCAKLVVLQHLDAMDAVSSEEEAACVQEILRAFETRLDPTAMVNAR